VPACVGRLESRTGAPPETARDECLLRGHLGICGVENGKMKPPEKEKG